MRSFLVIFSFLAFVLIIEACTNTTKPRTEEEIRASNLGEIAALPLTFKSPVNNPTTEEKVELGRILFYDPILSGGKDVSCASCHHPEFGYAESLELSIGVGGKGLGENRYFVKPGELPFTQRNSQGLLNTAFNGIDMNGDYEPETAPMFWDLRAKGLEEQAIHPIKQLEEMRGNEWEEATFVEEIVNRLNAIPEYQQLFSEAFNEGTSITADQLAKALASFQRSLVANNSKFDQYMRGDENAMTSSEKEGMKLFMQSGCARCHNGPMLSDFQVHVLGVPDNENVAKIDSGFINSFAFRTPSLRNLRFTAPYMHTGKIKSLKSVLTFYEDLKNKPLPSKHVDKNQLARLAQMIEVNFKDIPHILEFLNTLNDDQYDRKIPEKVPSGLPVGGDIK
jgi:cytochrome c peroxidase